MTLTVKMLGGTCRWTVCVALTSLAAVFSATGPQAGQPAAQETAEALEASAGKAEETGQLREAFDLYMRAVQALPDPPPLDIDVRLRGRLIALAPRLQPPPTIPEDAERFTVRGQALFKDAQDGYVLEEAATELRKAVRAAPWAPELAFNLALVQEKQEFYRGTTANLKLYVGSSRADAQELKPKIYDLELRGERSPLARLKEDCNSGSMVACESVTAVLRDQRACSLGDVAAACSRMSKYSDRDTALRDFPNGLYWGYSRPCAAGGLTACRGLLRLALVTYGTIPPALDHQLVAAIAASSEACDNGNAPGCTELGDAIINGLAKDAPGGLNDPRALQLFTKGCQGGDAKACQRTGMLYQLGQGGATKNPRLGSQFYKRACQLGDEWACDTCRRYPANCR